MYTFTVNFAVAKKIDGTVEIGKCYVTKDEKKESAKNAQEGEQC